MFMMFYAKSLGSEKTSEIKAEISENDAKGKFEIDDHDRLKIKKLLLENVKSVIECVIIDVDNVRRACSNFFFQYADLYRETNSILSQTLLIILLR